ncbi:MAG: beta-lactamase family protein, partial [Thermoplasmata archaeon]|nr:beta-lactamase family protein [Thermoplasmata archaeon]
TSAPPGEHFHYSNVGYKTVGLAVESVTGKSIADIVRERVVEPLGMRATTTTINNDVRDWLAVGYADLRDDRPRPLRAGLAPATWGESDTGDGSICSTADDMARYMRMLLNKGKGPKGATIIPEKTFALLAGRHVKDGDGLDYGYGLWSTDVEGHVHVEHTGGMVGFHSSLVVDMDMGIGVFASVNGPGEPAKVTKAVLASVRAAAEGRKTIPADAALPDPYSVKSAKDYAGEFVCGDRTLEFAASRNSLNLVRGKQRIRMDLRGPDEFYAGSPGHDRFLFRFVRSGGMVTEVVHGPDVYRRPGTTNAPGACPKEWEAFAGHYRSYNPWLSNFRIVPRGEGLAVIYPWGVEEPLTHLGGSKFRAGSDPLNPETVSFELVIGGKAQVARIAWGVYTRTFTP